MNRNKKPLSETHPELAKEAHGWDPEVYIPNSHETVSWICDKGHIWESKLYNRKNHRNCPYCVNKKVSQGFNDLSTTHPELSKEAVDWDPKIFVAGSSRRVTWRCENKHEWMARIVDRVDGSNCPYCAYKKVLAGFNDLATTHPEIAKEAYGWDPSEYIAGNVKIKKWICQKKHIWNSSINNRTQGYNCPFCGNRKLLTGFNDLATTHPALAKEAVGWNTSKYFAGSKAKVKWKCESNHIWISSILNRVNGSGCPSCSKTGYDPNQNGYVYFLIHPKWELYQIGITNNPDMRIKQHKKIGFELIELRGPIDGQKAQELETALLRYLKSQKADLSPDHVAGKFDGYSESWTIDSYKVNNLKELIDKASEAGF